MNKRRTLIYIGIVFAIAVVFVVLTGSFGFWSLLMALITAVFCGTLVSHLLSRKETAKSTPVPEPAPDKTAQRLNSLVSLNLKLRKDPDRDDEVVSLVEEIIDALSELVAKLNSQHPSSDLTYQINRVADEYLLTTVNKFLELSPASRAQKKKALTESLTALKERIQVIVSRIDTLAESEFSMEAKMLKTLVEN